MKINNITSNRLNKKGMTLIEISLVVALLLSLIAILFVGIAAYKKGADRSKCVINITSVQKAVRSHQNMYEMKAADALPHADIIGPGLYIEQLVEPAGDAYGYADVVTAVGTAYLTCGLAGGTTYHAPGDKPNATAQDLIDATSGW